MATAAPVERFERDEAESARLHFVLRFSVGTTAAFVTCELFGWQPSALAPVLTGVLLANLPVPPPPKVGVVLVVVMGISAWLAFLLTTWFSQAPTLLVGVIGFFMFRESLTQFKLGYGAAATLVLLVAVLVVSLPAIIQRTAGAR